MKCLSILILGVNIFLEHLVVVVCEDEFSIKNHVNTNRKNEFIRSKRGRKGNYDDKTPHSIEDLHHTDNQEWEGESLNEAIAKILSEGNDSNYFKFARQLNEDNLDKKVRTATSSKGKGKSTKLSKCDKYAKSKKKSKGKGKGAKYNSEEPSISPVSSLKFSNKEEDIIAPKVHTENRRLERSSLKKKDERYIKNSEIRPNSPSRNLQSERETNPISSTGERQSGKSDTGIERQIKYKKYKKKYPKNNYSYSNDPDNKAGKGKGKGLYPTNIKKKRKPKGVKKKKKNYYNLNCQSEPPTIYPSISPISNISILDCNSYKKQW